MHQKIRMLHGLIGLALALAILVYAVGGWMIYHSLRLWDRVEPTVEMRSVEALSQATPERAAARRVAEQLLDELQVKGRLGDVKGNAAGWTARYGSATTQTEIKWADGDREVRIEFVQKSPGGVLAGLHRMHGRGGGPGYFVYAVFVDLLALSMIGFAVTGVWLWWRLKSKRRGPGWVALGASSALTLAMILQFTFGR